MKQQDKVQSKQEYTFLKYRSYLLYFSVVLLLIGTMEAQEKKLKVLTPKEYNLWSRLFIKEFSNDAQWISYTLNKADGQDTLFVKSTTAGQTYAFSRGYNGKFNTKGWFAVRNPHGLILIHLASGKQQQIPDVISYAFTASGKELVYCTQNALSVNKFEVLELGGPMVFSVSGVDRFKMNESNTALIYNTITAEKSAVTIALFGKKLEYKTIENSDSDIIYHGFEWNSQGTGVGFFKKTKNQEGNQVVLYKLKEDKIKTFIPANCPSFPLDGSIVPFGSYKLSVADDLENIVFAVNFPLKKSTSSSVQLWAGNAPWIYPQQELWTVNNTAKMGVWFPDEERFSTISSDELPWLMLTGNQKYAVVANPQKYEPQFEYKNGPVDYYLLDLKTGKKELFLQKQSSYKHITIPSPKGKYITYFRDKNWWVYNVKDKKHLNITVAIPSDFQARIIDRPIEITAEGFVGWTPNEATILLYDQFDLWEIDPVTLKANRLTKGAEEGICFRLAAQNERVFTTANYDGTLANTFNLSDEFVLTGGYQDGSVGLFSWSRKEKERELFKSDAKITSIIRRGSSYVFLEQRHNSPPQIKLLKADKKSKTIIQSNTQHWNYEWSEMKEITYKDSKGNALKGCLYYPSSYDPRKKYPMIVHIYERQSADRQVYINPKRSSSEGFNRIDYTSNGYFVFFPDILYEIGNLGHAAVDCTVAGTKAVLDLGLIHEDKVGLIGHSFGGYETDFIITQTNIFATAVAGAAVTDMRSFYLTYSKDTGMPDMWRFEHQQWRMGKSYFEDKKGYENNAPLNYVENITTPLLSWAGNNDGNIDWKQSVDFYLALRRLKKPHVLLLYDGESHSLLKSENQIDLSERIRQWFAYFLKEEIKIDWITNSLK